MHLTMQVTYKYKCRVQVLIIFLHELLVVLLGLLVVVVVEFGTKIFLWWIQVNSLSIRIISVIYKTRDKAYPSAVCLWDSSFSSALRSPGFKLRSDIRRVWRWGRC